MNKLGSYGVAILVAIFLVVSMFQCSKIKTLKTNNKIIKEELLNLDSLKEISDNVYEVMVNDLHDKNSIIDSIESENKAFVDRIDALRKSKKRVITTSQIEFKYIDRTDTIYEKVESLKWSSWYYPNKENFIVQHNLWLNPDKNISYSKFFFKPIQLDILVYEDKAGIFKADLVGPSFIKLNDLTVNTLPIPTLTTCDEFDWLLGGGVNTRFDIELNAGLRWRRHMIFGGLTTDKTLTFNYLKGF